MNWLDENILFRQLKIKIAQNSDKNDYEHKLNYKEIVIYIIL